MRKTLLLMLITLPVFARSAGAPVNLNNIPGRTAAPGDGVCRDCHTGSPLNEPGGSLRIEAGTYKPGIPQTVKVTISHPNAERWGFQITARWAKDPTQNAGRFNAPNSDVQVLTGGYVTHTLPGTLSNGANGAKTFEVEWVAPEGTDDSDVIFYAAGNAANNNAGSGSGNQGDRIYTTQTRIQTDITCAFTERPTLPASGRYASTPWHRPTTRGSSPTSSTPQSATRRRCGC